MSDVADMIRFEDVSKCFVTPARGSVWAVRDLNLACVGGEFTCVLGPSGCGKTTLLRVAAGLAAPTQGRVFVNGNAVAGVPENVGMVSQEGAQNLAEKHLVGAEPSQERRITRLRLEKIDIQVRLDLHCHPEGEGDLPLPIL